MTEPDLVGGPSVSFVLPSYNEEANIERAIDQTRAVAERVCSQWEILIVDDGSTDRTGEIVRGASTIEPSIKLVSHGCNRGYGEALRSGFAAAQFDFVFFTDADNQFDMNDFDLLMAWADRADVVAGYRKVRRDTFMRQVNAWGWNRLVRMLFYVPVRDIDCAFKLIKREALEQIDIESRGAMINTEIMVKLARSGCLIIEVGVNHFPRTAGAPQGAKLRVIARALREVKRMYPHLSGLAPQAENAPAKWASIETGTGTAQLEFDSLAIAQERWGTTAPDPRVESTNGHPNLVLTEELGRRTGSSTR
jgi:glycosyltransferase involved in cell wall biosynthesis